MNKREAILEATVTAQRLHRDLKSEALIRERGGGVDVFGVILSYDIPLLFRPLKNLLGGYFPPPDPGIIITSERSLAIQRFTGAHELGHHVMGHPGSLDPLEILERKRRYGDDLNEVAANSFAAEFLLPLWLFEDQGERQGWDADSFEDPRVVYQLSLRAGASYEATVRQLTANDVIDEAVRDRLLKVTPKSLKQELLDGHQLEKSRANVWLLTERDQGSVIQGGPDDVFIFRLKQRSGAGYLWNLEDLEEMGFSVIFDTVAIPDPKTEIGGPVERLAAGRMSERTGGKITLTESQPWEPDSIASFLELDFQLAEERGESQNERRAAAGVA